MAKFKAGINQMRRKDRKRENKRAEEKMGVEASREAPAPQPSKEQLRLGSP